jgi:hypothetical protein
MRVVPREFLSSLSMLGERIFIEPEESVDHDENKIALPRE